MSDILRDSGPGLELDPSNGVGEQDPLLKTVPPELIDVLGIETALAVADGIDRLDRIGNLARTGNPFGVTDKADDLDLSLLDPKLAQRVKDHAEGRLDEEYPELSEGVPGWIRNLRFGVLSAKLEGAGSDLSTKLIKRSAAAESSLVKLDKRLKPVLTNEADAKAPTVGLEVVEAFMSSLYAIAGQVPSGAESRGLDQVFAAAVDVHKHNQREINSSHRISLVPVSAAKTLTGKAIRLFSRQAVEDTKKLDASISNVRDHGTRSHRSLVRLARAEQVRQAVELIEIIDSAEQQIPRSDQLEEQGRLDAALVAEKYLAGQAREAKATIRLVDPTRLGQDERLRHIANRAQLTSLASSIAISRTMAVDASRTELKPKIPHADLSEAHKVLVGGRHLDPSGDQTQEYVERTADTLRKVLDETQSGLVMAMVTGRFNAFVQTLDQAKEIATTGPTYQGRVVGELQDFDLEAGLVDIRKCLHDSAQRAQLRRILSVKVLDRVVGPTITTTLEQLRADSDAVLHS
jgi:hypothetical protein